MKHVMQALIRLYRRLHRPGVSYCKYVPTCSVYALEAYELHGFFKGTALSVWRILRCNPFSRGGYDPVPARNEKATVCRKK